jgi:integrase
MNLREHDTSNGMKVWLSDDDVELLLDAAQDTEQEVAFALAARCGLRSHEVLDVAPGHVVETDAGTMLTVPSGKGDKYRETPIPDALAKQIRTIDDMRDANSDDPIISVTTTQSLRNWIQRARETLAEQDDDERWLQVSFHDLRRTWATSLASRDVDPLIVCDWGGWSDLDTFLEHYRGVYSPEAQQRERSKVNWL